MNTLLRRKHPRQADRVTYMASNALAIAVEGNPKKLASAAGVSDRLAREWLSAHPGSPVARFFELAASIGQGAAAMVAAAKTILFQGLVAMTPAELRREFWRIQSDETRCEGVTNMLQTRERWSTEDLRELARAAIEEASQLERLAAVALECAEREMTIER